MTSRAAAAPNPSPVADIDRVACVLPQQTARLSRLFLRLAGGGMSRSEATVLTTVAEGPRRITELAELEGLAQPTVTVLVNRLQEQGLVARERDRGDARAVLVTITEAGAVALEELRARYRAALRAELASMPDEDVTALLEACAALEGLARALQDGDRR